MHEDDEELAKRRMGPALRALRAVHGDGDSHEVVHAITWAAHKLERLNEVLLSKGAAEEARAISDVYILMKALELACGKDSELRIEFHPSRIAKKRQLVQDAGDIAFAAYITHGGYDAALREGESKTKLKRTVVAAALANRRREDKEDEFFHAGFIVTYAMEAGRSYEAGIREAMSETGLDRDAVERAYQASSRLEAEDAAKTAALDAE